MDFATRAIHAGQDADPATGATIVPIYATSTYTMEEVGVTKGFDYSRTINPTRVALEKQLAALENATFGSAFGSGMAATSAVLNLLSAGDHVVVCDNVTVGGRSAVSKDVTEPGAYMGYPLQTWREGLRTIASLPSIVEICRELGTIQEKLNK